ncbi:MAG: hypothetical protein IJA94_00675 [Bacilli bacterium]|nr:hypothetical protein [Bacilli bacterium]
MSSINIDLSVLKEEVKGYLKSGSRFINSAMAKMRNISLPEDATFRSELNEISSILDTVSKNVNDSINTVNGRVEVFNQVEKSNKRFFDRLDDKYRVKDVEVKESTAEEKVNKTNQTESQVEEKPETIEETKASSAATEVEKVSEVESETVASQTATVVAEEATPTDAAAPILTKDEVEKETQTEKSESFVSKVSNWVGAKWDELVAWLKKAWQDFKAKWNNDQKRVLLPDWEMSDKTAEQVAAEISALDTEITDLVAQHQALNEKLNALIQNNGSTEEITALQNQIATIEQSIDAKIEQLSNLCIAQHLKGLTSEIDLLNGEIEDLEKQRSYLKAQINFLNSVPTDYAGMAGQAIGSVMTGAQTNSQKLSDLHVQLAAIEKQIDEKNAEMLILVSEKNNIERQLNQEFYLKFTENDDFEKYSDIVDKSDLVLSDEYIECTAYLTDYEKKMYAYLQRTKGTEASEEYLYTLLSEVNYRKGYDKAVEFLKEYCLVDEHGNIVLDESGNPIFDKSNEFYEAVMAVKKGFEDGANNFVDGIGNYFMGITGGMDTILSPEQYEQMIILQTLQSGDKSAYEISSSIGNMAIPMASSAIIEYFLPGSGVGSIVASSMMGVSSGGNAWKQAYSETVTRQVKRDENGNIITNENGEYEYVYSYTNGTSFKQAFLIGNATGVSEAVLGYTLGKIPGISKLDDVKVKNIPTLLKSVAANATSEGIEEGVQYLVGQSVEAAVTGKPLELSLEEGLKNVAYGVVTAGILNGGNAVVSVGGVVYSLNIDTSKVTDKNYINSVMSALNYKFEGTPEAYQNLSDEAKAIVDGATENNINKQYTEPIEEIEEVVEVEHQEMNDKKNVKETSSTTSVNSTLNNNSQKSTDSKVTEDIYSYSDQRTNVGEEFHNSSTNKQSTSEQIEVLDQGENSTIADKFSKAAALSQQIIENQAKGLRETVESHFDKLLNQDISKKDGIDILFDSLATAVQETGEDVKARIQNYKALNTNEYDQFVDKYLADKAEDQAYDEIDIMEYDDNSIKSLGIESDINNIKNNVQKEMDVFLEDIGLKDSTKNESVESIDSLSSDVKMGEDVYSYSDQHVNHGSDYSQMMNEIAGENSLAGAAALGVAGASAILNNITKDKFGIFNDVEYGLDATGKIGVFSKLKSVFNKNNQYIQNNMSDQYYYLNNSKKVVDFLTGKNTEWHQKLINETDFNAGNIDIDTGKQLENLINNDELTIGIHRAGDGSTNDVAESIVNGGLLLTGDLSSGVGTIDSARVDKNISFFGKNKVNALITLIGGIKSAHKYKSFSDTSNVILFAFPKDAIKDNGYADLTKYPDLIITNQNGTTTLNPKYIVGYVHNDNGNVGKINFNNKFFGFESTENNSTVEIEQLNEVDSSLVQETDSKETKASNVIAQLNANPADSYKQLNQNNSEVGLTMPNAKEMVSISEKVNDTTIENEQKELISSSYTGMLGQTINNGLQKVKSKFDTSDAIPVDFVEVDDADNSNGSIPPIDKTAPDILGLPSSTFGGMLSQVIPGTMTVIPSIFENVESVVVDATNVVENAAQTAPKIETLDDMSWLDDDVKTDYESIADAMFKKDEADTKIEYEAELGFNQVSQVVDGLKNQLADFNDLYIRKKSLFSFNSERARGLKTLNIRLNDVIDMINSFKRQGLEPNAFAKKTIDALEQGAIYVKKEFSSLDDAITTKSKLQQVQSQLLANLRSLNDQLQIINQGNITLNSDAKGIIEQINSLTKEINDLKYQTDKLDRLMEEQNAEIKKAQTLNRELIDTIDSSRFLNIDDINASRSLTDILEGLKRKYHKINNDLDSLDNSIDRIDRMIQSQVVAINNFFEEKDSFNDALKEITLEKVSSSPDNLVSNKLTSEQIYELASVSLNKNVPTLWEVVISDLKKLDINQKRKFITSLNNADLINQLSPTQFFNLCQDPETFNILIKNNLPRVARLFAKNITKPQVIGLLADLDPNQINEIFNETQVKEIINQMDPKQVWNLLALYNSKSYKWMQTEAILDRIISYNLEYFNEFLKNMSYFYIDVEGSNQLIKSANYSKYIEFINTINTKFYTIENLKLYPKMIDKVNSFLIFNNIDPIIKIRDNIKITTNEFYKTLSTKIIENSDITMNLNSDNKLSFNVEEGKTYDLVFMVNDKVNKKSYTAYSNKISIEDLLTLYSKEILNNKVSIKSFEFNEIKSKLSITLENGYSKGLHLISLIVDGTKYDKLIEVRQFSGKNLNQDFPNAKSVEILSDKVIEYKPLNVENNGIYKINYRIGDLESSFYLGAKENNGAYILDVQNHILANQLVGAEILNWEVFDVVNIDSSNLLIYSMLGMSEIFTGIKYGGNQSDVSDIILNYYNNNLDNNILKAKAKVLEDIVKKYYPDATQIEIINLTASYAECGCGYMAISNALTTYALSNERLKNNFSKTFGYDLYFEDEKGKWYNTDAIALDIYLGLFAHDSSIKEMINNDGGLNQQLLEHKDLKSFFDKHNLKFTPYVTFNSTYEQLMADIINSQKYGYFTILAAKNFDMEQMTNNRKFAINSDKSLEDSRKIGAVREKVGGHAMLITDIDKQHNLIVSSWSDKYKYIPESLKKYEDSYMKLFNVKFELKEG